MREDARQKSRGLQPGKPEGTKRAEKITFPRYAPEGGAASACAILHADGVKRPDERIWEQVPPRCKQDGRGTKRHEMLGARGDGLRKWLRITSCLAGNK